MKKKTTRLALFSALLIALLWLSACSSSGDGLSSDQWTETTACIIKAEGGSLLLYQEEPGLFYISLTDARISGAEGQSLSPADLTNGRMIRFTTNGVNDLLYPATFDTNGRVELLDEENAELYEAGQKAAQDHLRSPS